MNNFISSPSPLGQKIADKINAGQIKMRPKTYFTISRVLGWLSALLFFTLLVLLTSFICYVIHYNSRLLPGFGWLGFNNFISTLPLLIIILIIALALLLSWFAYQTTAAYKQPTLYLIIFIILLSLGTGLLINYTHLHDLLAKRAIRQQLPIIGSLYRQNLSGRWNQAITGTIISKNDNTWEVRDELGEDIKVTLGQETFYPFDRNFEVGDEVIIRGQIKNNQIIAQGVRKLNEDEKNFVPFRMGPAMMNHQPLLPPPPIN